MSKTIKDLCFLLGTLLPPLALILSFTVKNDEYRKAFKLSIIYGVTLWVVMILAFHYKMFEPISNGISDL
ncbi:MAG: hypothetical protein K2G37_04375 [Clostridia bacterium]|nr:hypothetical protein [Clostridia bacterium]MDE7329087.1 hypothetical protein [Clostridia bacterium]